MSSTCDRPPEGWTCQLEYGHEGPCPAWPIDLRPDVRVKRQHKHYDVGVQIPRYESSGAVGFDLAPAYDVFIEPGEIERVSTGLVIATPEDHVLYITFRSSTPLRHGVIVLEGIIDPDYSGDDDTLGLQVWNFKDTPAKIKAGTRIAQGVFMPVTRAHFVEVPSMDRVSRGGYGSTG